MGYSKPQSPLQINGEYIYPLTTYDQIINADGSRGYDVTKNVPYLYAATLKQTGWTGQTTFTQTVSISPISGGEAVTASFVITSPPMCEQTSSVTTNNILMRNLSRINNGNISLGAGTVTVTVFEKPDSDIEIILQIKKG